MGHVFKANAAALTFADARAGIAEFFLEALQQVNQRDGQSHPGCAQRVPDRSGCAASHVDDVGGNPVLLEPFMRIVVMVPIEYVGDIINFFNSNRGEIVTSDMKKGGGEEGPSQMRVIEASAPLKELNKTFRLPLHRHTPYSVTIFTEKST